MFPNTLSWTRDQLQQQTETCAFTLPWMEALSLESESLNVEHRAMLQELNGLLVAIRSGDRTRIAMACTRLSAEAHLHFTSEEAQMREAGYPELESHAAQHGELRRGLALLRYSVCSGAGLLSTTAPLSCLERWFVPHLTFADKRAADFLYARAVLSRIGIAMPGMIGGVDHVGESGDDAQFRVGKPQAGSDDLGDAGLHEVTSALLDAALS